MVLFLRRLVGGVSSLLLFLSGGVFPTSTVWVTMLSRLSLQGGARGGVAANLYCQFDTIKKKVSD